MTMLSFHPLANLFPMIEGDEFDALSADIKSNGLRDKIVLLDGQILDGRNRYRAGLMAEVVDVRGVGLHFRDFSFVNDGDPLKFVLSKNLARRHLNESQRAMVAARIANLGHGGARGEQAANLPLETMAPPITQSQAASSLNVSPRLVRDAKAVQDKGTPALQHAVDSGKLAASQAAKAATLPEPQQDAIAKKAEAGEANVVRTVLKQNLRDQREQALGQKQLALPDKKYGVILADPEWEFTVFSKVTGMDRAPDNHYQTSSEKEISARDVQKLAAQDCMLALWVTDLARGIRVMESWGFAYKSYFVWVKDIVEGPFLLNGQRYFVEVGPPGLGYWNRDRDELCLIGTRGNFVAPAMGTQGESAWFAARPKLDTAERGKHSAKPENAHLWIEKHWPTLPRIELNARKARAGWDVWGFEAPEQPQNDSSRSDAPAGLESSPHTAPVVTDFPGSDLPEQEVASTAKDGLNRVGGGSAPILEPVDTVETLMEIPAFLRRPQPGGEP